MTINRYSFFRYWGKGPKLAESLKQAGEHLSQLPMMIANGKDAADGLQREDRASKRVAAVGNGDRVGLEW
jgi:hypothetical protein